MIHYNVVYSMVHFIMVVSFIVYHIIFNSYFGNMMLVSGDTEIQGRYRYQGFGSPEVFKGTHAARARSSTKVLETWVLGTSLF